MTAPSPAPAKAKSPHTGPTIASVVTGVAGFLVTLAGLFHIGHPGVTADTVAVPSGLLAAVAAAGYGILSHLGISKAQAQHDVQLAEQEWPVVQRVVGQAEADFPGLAGRVDALEAGLQDRVTAAVTQATAALNIPAEGDLVNKAVARVFAAMQLAQQQSETQAGGEPTPAPAPPAPGPATT